MTKMTKENCLQALYGGLLLGGGGGGRPQMAQGAGKDASKADEILAKIENDVLAAL